MREDQTAREREEQSKGANNKTVTKSSTRSASVGSGTSLSDISAYVPLTTLPSVCVAMLAATPRRGPRHLPLASLSRQQSHPSMGDRVWRVRRGWMAVISEANGFIAGISWHNKCMSPVSNVKKTQRVKVPSSHYNFPSTF